MAYDGNKPADAQTIALGPQDIRENFRALKDDKIVNAAKVNDYVPGNGANNILALDGNGLTPLANIPGELTGKNAPTSTNATNHINNATNAHAGSAIGITATAYGKGLSTNETTVQKVADRVNQNGTPQFVTDSSKCSLLLDFKNGLADKTRGIVPANYNSAVKWSDNYINDNSSKEVATNISCTFKQFEGDEGLFGSGVAVEESRTNMFAYSEDLTNATWTKINCTVTLDRVLPDGRKLFKVVATASDTAFIVQGITGTAVSHTWSIYGYSGGAVGEFRAINNGFYAGALLTPSTSKMTRASITATAGVGIGSYGFAINATAGDTFYITSPQLEAGAFPTSYIATGATAVTRPAGKISYDASVLNGKTNFTISLWAKPNFNYDITKYPTLFQFSTNANIYWNIAYSSSTDKFNFCFGDGATKYILQLSAYTSNASLNKWQHFVLKQSGVNAYVYIDNILQGTISNATIPVNALYFDIGYDRFFANREANTDFSNFAIFNYALSEAEISQIYNSGLEGKPVEVANAPDVVAVDRLTKAINATYADHATTADSATSAGSATNATNANHATTADSATSAGSATNATNATNADTLDSYHAAAFALVGHTTHTGEAASLATSGYKKFADGTIIQWGQASWLANESSKVVIFPIAFPLEPKSILVLPYTTSMTYAPYKIAAAHGSNYFTAYRTDIDAPINFYWFAIGY